MKILLLTPKPPYPARDGSSLATARLTEGLAARGHQVTVFFLNTSKHRAAPGTLPEIPGVSFLSAYCDTAVRLLPALASLLSGKYPYTVSRFITPDTIRTLRTLLARTSYDIIQFEGLMMTPYLDVLGTTGPARIIFRPHNTEYLIWQQLAENEKNPLKKHYLRLLARQILTYERSVSRRFRYILPISEKDAEVFRAWQPHAGIMPLPYGIPLPDRPSRPAPPRPVLLFLGALDWRPNIQGLTWFLREVWPRLVKNIPDMEFIIAGRNPDAGMERLVRRASSGDNIVFQGEIEDAEELYAKSDLFLVPLFAGSGIRIKILEAMSRGLAVISTHTGAAGLPVRHRQHILLADTADEFIRAITELLQEKKLFRNITGNALLLLKEKFDPEVLSENLENFYRTP